MMKDKKNIEKLFQEKFKNLEVNPPESAWEYISERLRNKKRRRVLPFWLKPAGIAASLLLGFMYFNSVNTADNQLKTDENSITVNQESELKNSNSTTNVQVDDIIKSIPENTSKNPSSTQNQVVNSSLQNLGTTEKTLIEVEHKVAAAQNSNLKNNTFSKNNNTSNITDNHKVSKFNLNVDSETISYSNTTYTEASINQSKSLNSSDNSSEKNLLNNKYSSEDINNENPKQIIENQEDIVVEETPVVDEAFTEFLAKLEQDKESENEKDKDANFDRWRITPNVAPIAFNSFSDGSPISEQFADNSKDYLNSISVGLGINYALTEKFSMRTGVNKFMVGYNTNDVAFYASVNASEIVSNNLNVNFVGNTSNIILKPENILVIHNESSSQHVGYINQKIGFIEVPLEFSYKLLNTKFNIDVIGGMSTLFLQENEVSVVSNGMQAVLGEANNLNDVHFSTNFGIGFRYEIFKSFEASVEPMFKYQIGTFNKNDGNFKPYILGVYTGLSFKF